MKLAITPLVLSTATFGLMLAVPQNAQAAGLIRNVTATVSNAGIQQLGNINFTTNGAGLQGPPLNRPSLTGTHASTDTANAWRSSQLGATVPLANISIEFAFNRVYNLAGFSFWNTGGSDILAKQGIKNVTIQYKLNSGSWTTLTGAPTSFNPGSTTTAATVVQEFSFSSVWATHVRFSSMTLQGTNNGLNNRLGFSEIQFRSIPEPSSTLALLALGLAGMGVGLRKRV